MKCFDIEDNKIDEFKVKSNAATTDLKSIDKMTCDHVKNLVDAIRNGTKLNSPIDEGNISVTILQLSNVAWKVGRDLHLDTRTAHILNDEEAMRNWKRDYEKGWELKI